MTTIAKLSPGTYVIAVSGGVDSVALLDMLQSQRHVKLIVAHVNHGIRDDSAEDAALVETLAKRQGLLYEQAQLNLGTSTSEERARHARYAFLQAARHKHDARAIITAHHADDVVETVIINMLRGTGWRGLCSLRSSSDYVRPLLGVYKAEILAYAQARHLTWREDSTNLLKQYLRNYVRHDLLPRLLPRDPLAKQKLHELWAKQCRVRAALEPQLEAVYALVADQTGLKRAPLTKVELAVADELLRHFLHLNGVRQTAPQRTRALQFIFTAKNTKKFSLNERAFLQLSREHVTIAPRSQG